MPYEIPALRSLALAAARTTGEVGKQRSNWYVLLAMELRRWAGDGRPLPRLPSELESYLSRMHVWQAAGLTAPTDVAEHNASGRFLPATPLRESEEVSRYARNLVEIAHQQGVDESTLDSLGIVIEELINNCFDHARVEEDLTGIVCAQAWPRGHRAQIAFADPGIGIRRSLAWNPVLTADLEAQNACELASRYGTTGRPDKHTGYGLALARQLMELNDGVFAVCSDHEYLVQEGDRMVEGRDLDPCPGTLVILEWRTDRVLRVSEVYEHWPLPEGMDEDDFF